jgi:hypothetical protein
MADDGFTQRRFRWLDQIASDPGISGSTCKLAILIACRFLNRKTNTAWPSQPVLAELLGIRTREGVRYCVDQLVAGGHLAVAVSHGRGTSNRYRIIIKEIAAHDDPDETKPDHETRRLKQHCFRMIFHHPRKPKPHNDLRSMSPSMSGGSNIPKRLRRPRRGRPITGL